MREFVTAAVQATETPAEEAAGMQFKVDDRVLTAYKPGDGQLAVLMATMGSHMSTQEMIAGIINFFVSVLDDESHQYLVGRLLDRTDPFGVKEVQDIMEGLIEDWSGRPTGSPSGFTSSPESAGPRSTPTTTQLT